MKLFVIRDQATADNDFIAAWTDIPYQEIIMIFAKKFVVILVSTFSG
jgi:hypothetical protein